MHTNSFRVGIENRTHAGPAEQSEKALAHLKIEIDRRKEGWDSQSQGCRLSSLPTRWRVVMRLSHDAHVIPGNGHVAQDHWDEFRLAVSWGVPHAIEEGPWNQIGFGRADQCGGHRRTR